MDMTSSRDTGNAMSEAIKVLGAVALLSAYAMLSHWIHTDRIVADAEELSPEYNYTLISMQHNNNVQQKI
jgi:hypothetical protein